MFYLYNFKAPEHGSTLRERCLNFSEYLIEFLDRHQIRTLIISEEVGVVFEVIDAFEDQLKLHSSGVQSNEQQDLFGCFYLKDFSPPELQARPAWCYTPAFSPSQKKIDIYMSRGVKPSYLLATASDGVHTIKIDGFMKCKEKAG